MPCLLIYTKVKAEGLIIGGKKLNFFVDCARQDKEKRISVKGVLEFRSSRDWRGAERVAGG